MITIRRLLALILVIISISLLANADNDKKFERNGNVYSSTISSTGRVKAQPVKTKFTYQDSKGKVYDIYISETGSCYVIKTSAKTGKEYKYYIGPEISQDICNILGKEYKGKKK